MDPGAQGAIPIYLDGVDILEEEVYFSTMKFFPVICGHPTRRLWLQHAVIMLRDGRLGGPLIIFPTKSICLAAIIFRMQGME